jgi:hypothetical protein
MMDYKTHIETSCTQHISDRAAPGGITLHRKIQKLQKDREALQLQLEQREQELEHLRVELVNVQQERDARVDPQRFQEVKDGIRQLSDQLKHVLQENNALRQRPDVEPLFTGEYDYDRFNVTKLAQLISRYLTNKPSNIDSNVIYQRVETCYRDLRQGWDDNPPLYDVHVRMLLTTCYAASTAWFSEGQLRRIRIWMEEQHWYGTSK